MWLLRIFFFRLQFSMLSFLQKHCFWDIICRQRFPKVGLAQRRQNKIQIKARLWKWTKSVSLTAAVTEKMWLRFEVFLSWWCFYLSTFFICPLSVTCRDLFWINGTEILWVFSMKTVKPWGRVGMRSSWIFLPNSLGTKVCRYLAQNFALDTFTIVTLSSD